MGRDVTAVRAAWLLLASATLAAPARADLATDAAALASGWTAAGLTVTRLPALFVEHGPQRVPRLPASALDPATATCATVAFVAPRTVDFAARVEPRPAMKRFALGAQVERSLGGVATVARCGAAKAQLAELAVELRAAHAAVELVVAEGPATAPPPASILADRAVGPVARPVDASPPPLREPMAARVARAEASARRAGQGSVRMLELQPGADGSGRQVVRFDDGCHRIDLLAEAPPDRPLDLDAEARDASTQRVLARDRGDATDARLEICLGDATPIEIVFAGATAGAVHLIDARTPLATTLPSGWGPRPRAGFAAALARRRFGAPARAPIATWTGVAGVTAAHAELVPGACYLASVAVAQGESRGLALSAHLGAATFSDAVSGPPEALAVAFCATSPAPVELDVEARGGNVTWVLSLWQVAERDPGGGS